jgi:solute carrier family 25 citrate transporter 1
LAVRLRASKKEPQPPTTRPDSQPARPQIPMAPTHSDKAKSPAKALIAGGISGGLEIIITYPTEYVKTQLQLSEKTKGPHAFTGPIDVVKKTVREKGFFGLYRGLSSLLYFSIPKAMIRFAAFEQFKSLFQRGTNRPLRRWETLLSGMGAGICEAIGAVTPMETIKVKFIHDQVISEKPRFRGFFHGVTTIVREAGISGIYKGLFPTILKQSTNQAIRFVVYSEVTTWMRKDNPTKALSPIQTFIAGGIAGAASVFGNTPIDVVKTRMQGLESHRYKSSWDCAVSIAKNEGLLAFYKGTTPRLGRVCLDVALVFTFYEQIVKLLDKFW